MRSERNYPSIAIAVIVIAFILIAAVVGVERESLARKAALGGDFVDMDKIKVQMQKGNLSNHEAEFQRDVEVELGY